MLSNSNLRSMWSFYTSLADCDWCKMHLLRHLLRKCYHKEMSLIFVKRFGLGDSRNIFQSKKICVCNLAYVFTHFMIQNVYCVFWMNHVRMMRSVRNLRTDTSATAQPDSKDKTAQVGATQKCYNRLN